METKRLIGREVLGVEDLGGRFSSPTSVGSDLERRKAGKCDG